MERIISHHIIFDGRDFGLSVAEISEDHRGVNILPFSQELHSTAWVDGPVHIEIDDCGLYFWTCDAPASIRISQS